MRFLLLISILLTMGCGMQPASPRSLPGEMTTGKKLYMTRCMTCHQRDGSGAIKGRRWAADFTDPNGVLSRSDADLMESIRKGKEGEFSRMPAFGPTVSDQDMKDVLGYIRKHFNPTTATPEPKPTTTE